MRSSSAWQLGDWLDPAAHRTPCGLAEVAWERAEGGLRVDVTVPTGSVATVVLPGLEPREIECGRHRFVVPHPGPQADREWHPSPPFPLDVMFAEGDRRRTRFLVDVGPRPLGECGHQSGDHGHCCGALFSEPPWSRRNGGYASVIRVT
ncbi:hypothetical protein OG485_05530 [Streptomyces sp. NBC_00328]